MPADSRLHKFGLIAAICTVSILADAAGLFTHLNRNLGDTRMALSPKTSQGQIVFVAVDAQSVSSIGTWPWSRAIHASLLDATMAQGAVDVLFDFDFTFPADTAGDQAFVDALSRAGGSTYLAVFEQFSTISATTTRSLNQPMPAFAEQGWPALVNVRAAANGLVREYPFGAQLGEEYVSSAAALMANQLHADQAGFEINFSIQPDTIPIISAIDLITGSIPEGALEGKIVIIGASAIELSDQLAVPVHGVIPGPLIHAVAAETLMRGLEPLWLRPEWVALCLAALLVALQTSVRQFSFRGVAGAAIGLASIEFGALYMFRTSSVLAPTAMLYPGILVFVVCRFLSTLSASNWLLLKANSNAKNTLSLLERVFDDSSDGIIIVKSDGSLLRHSRSAKIILGTDKSDQILLPRKFTRLAAQKDLPKGSHSAPLQNMEVGNDGARKLIEYHVTKSEIEVPLAIGKETVREQVTSIVFRDITRLKEQEKDIAYLSNYDDRTGALRRGAFLAFLSMRLEEGPLPIVFALRLDRLKTINITLGRSVGDALLKEVVARLEKSPLHISAPVRLDGTSFAFYTEGSVDRDKAQAFAQAILDDITRPFRLADANAQISGRIGYAITEDNPEISAQNALKQAEETMDATKDAGASIAAYDHTAWEKQHRARQIERALENALAENEFRMVYQPQHRISDAKLIGAEALIRWHSSTLGQVFPDEFIGIAESTGFISELGKWTLLQAAKDTKKLPDDLTIAVNVSGLQLIHSDFAADAHAILRQIGLPAHRICLELTETVLLASSASLIETMQDLRFAGLTWALDDFGTGFSSMEYLSTMPLDKVKLDKSFIQNLGQDPAARPILHATAELCRGLGVKLLCEGVETEEHLAVLADEGCDEAQGYLFGKPMPIEDLIPNARNLVLVPPSAQANQR